MSRVKSTTGVTGAAAILAALACITPAASHDRFTGPSIGVHGGYAFSPRPDDIGIRDAVNKSFIDNYGQLKTSGGFAGVGIGYGIRAGGLILGVDGDVSFGRVAGQVSNTKSGLAVSADGTASTMGTLRLRAGVPVSPMAQIYLTGGLAATNYTYKIAYAGVLNGSLARDVIAVGWTVGGGAEWAIDKNWSVKAEYLYANYINAHTISNANISTILHHQQSLVRVGVGYKF